MSKKSKKYDAPQAEVEQITPTMHAEELEQVQVVREPKPERAPRIVRPRFVLTDAEGTEIKFTHYALPTRRQAAGKIVIDGTETDFVVTKSTSRDKTEERAYSYFTLPNGATGYVSQELQAGAEFTTKELAPAAPFGREPKAKTEGGTLPRAEMPVEEEA
jgi:hypothetical protein